MWTLASILYRNEFMRARCAALVWLVAALGGSHWAIGDEPLRVRILSYNIHHAENTDGKLDLARIAEVIRESDADVVALQEVDRLVPRSEKVNQPAALASLLDMGAEFGANIPLDGGQYGNAILSRWKIERIANHALPNYQKGEQRGVLEVEIVLPGDVRLRLLNTHLDHRRDETERLESARAINALVESQPASGGDGAKRWTVLAGDINARPDSQTLAILLQRWQMSDKRQSPTIPSDEPASKIDYVLTLREEPAQFKLIEARVLAEKTASDHRPLLAVFERLAE